MAGLNGKWSLPYWVFQTHLAINGWLHRRLPKLFGDPNFVPMMTIQTSPYSHILTRIRAPFYTLASACVLMFAFLVAHLSAIVLA